MSCWASYSFISKLRDLHCMTWSNRGHRRAGFAGRLVSPP